MKNKFNTKERRDKFMTSLGEKCGFHEYEDWYRLTKKHFVMHGGLTLLQDYYESSIVIAVKDFLPDHKWLEWRFTKTPRNFFTIPDNRKRYINWLSEQLDIKALDDWYNINTRNAIDKSAAFDAFIKRFYKDSIFGMLSETFPDKDWKPWLFKCVPKNYWKVKNNRRQYVIWLNGKLNIGLYNLTPELFNANRGSGVIEHYDGSVCHAIVDCLPEANINEWLFKSTPQRFWKSKDNRLRYLKWLENTLGFKSQEDWYYITYDHFRSHAGLGVLSYYGGIVRMAPMELYPEFSWDVTKFYKRLGKKQKLLYSIVKEMHPKEMVLWNYFHPEIRSKRRRMLELDIFIPSLKIAFEYQGIQHYKSIFKESDSLLRSQENDEIKRRRCKELGIQLIEVDYKWRATKDDLLRYL